MLPLSNGFIWVASFLPDASLPKCPRWAKPHCLVGFTFMPSQESGLEVFTLPFLYSSVFCDNYQHRLTSFQQCIFRKILGLHVSYISFGLITITSDLRCLMYFIFCAPGKCYWIISTIGVSICSLGHKGESMAHNLFLKGSHCYKVITNQGVYLTMV